MTIPFAPDPTAKCSCGEYETMRDLRCSKHGDDRFKNIPVGCVCGGAVKGGAHSEVHCENRDTMEKPQKPSEWIVTRQRELYEKLKPEGEWYLPEKIQIIAFETALLEYLDHQQLHPSL